MGTPEFVAGWSEVLGGVGLEATSWCLKCSLPRAQSRMSAHAEGNLT